jgi:hypothetical protein
MKRLLISAVVIFVLLITVNVQAGQPLGSTRHWLASPHSMAFGMSLDEWMEAWVRWFEEGAEPASGIRNVAFLPIVPGPNFEVYVEVGTALVLPVATWLGFDLNDTAPDDWFGDREHIWGELQLNGGPAVEINEDYYVGPTFLEPPAVLFDIDVYLYQALVCLILPLPAGEHEIVLHSEFVDFGEVFDNTWNIIVLPRNGTE